MNRLREEQKTVEKGTKIRNEIDEYKYKTELHAHSSEVSWCGRVCAAELVRLYAARGADAVVLTNHFFYDMFKDEGREAFCERYVAEYEKAAELGKSYGINVLFGMEIRFTENINDYLIYGMDTSEVKKAGELVKKGIDVFYREFKTERNVILQAHPFRDNMQPIRPQSVDGIEVFNMHPDQNSRVGLAARYASENNMLISGGTDFHIAGHEGCCMIRTKFKPKTSFDIAEVLKNGDFLFDIGGNIVVPYNFMVGR